jgi:hypothetical protein
VTTLIRGAANTLTAEWREFAGGPFATVTAVTITVTPLAGGAAVLATTTTGVTYPSTGVNVYVWTPSNALPVGSYLVAWSATDSDLDVIGAAEIVELSAGGLLGGPYADRATLKRRMSIPDANTLSDTDADFALVSASDTINRWTQRQFGQDTDVSERSYAAGATGVDTDDFWTTDGLVVSGAAFDVSSPAYALEPVNGIQDGVPGWPYRRLTNGGLWSSLLFGGSTAWTVTVSAKWGWAAVPANIQMACLLLAADALKSKDAPFGVAGFGDYVIRVRANPKVMELLAPYVRTPVLVA